ncbi:uncharacterized protein LOC125838851 [Solanum verrucosum]|uniref:uncharacterized protein LOC125838851 n=1 Tax=Solanum verrucosum TaxID=315347 RepID=UPI0020CFEAA2|nr:uncharacterized protein LOC125838851 [Solanum verrucosum]
MVMDYLEHAKKCQACQFHANYSHQYQEALHPTVASWPFDAYGLDVVGPFPKSSKGQIYGIPRCIVTDNGTPFNNKLMSSLCEKCSFKQHKPSMYNALANGLAEAFNKILGNLLNKVVAKNKRDWHERIGEALWAYCTTFRIVTQAILFSLVYGVEAVLPLEKQIPSL